MRYAADGARAQPQFVHAHNLCNWMNKNLAVPNLPCNAPINQFSLLIPSNMLCMLRQTCVCCGGNYLHHVVDLIPAR